MLVNIGDERHRQAAARRPAAAGPDARSQAPAKLEMELEELSEEDRKAFMQDLGLTGFSRDEVLRRDLLRHGPDRLLHRRRGRVPGLADAARAPTPSKGPAQIHTDLARGFVRAEVVSYDDFQRVGSMKEAKSHGVYRLEGKTYIVQDGDIMHILAST